MPGRRRMPQNIHLRVGLRLGVHSFFHLLRHLERDDLRRVSFSARNAAKVAFAQLGRLIGLEVANKNECDVLRGVVERIKLVGLSFGDGRNVRRPANHRPAVGVRFPKKRLERLLKFTQRGGLGAHAALFEHNIALGIKFAEHRSQQAFRLHPRPKLKLVRRHSDEIAGHVVGGEGVHAGRAGGGVNAVELVFDEHFAMRVDQFLELDLEFAITLGFVFRLGQVIDFAPPQGQTHFTLLQAHGIAHLLLLFDDLGVALGIARANGRRTLEHHVLEEVRDAGDARPLVHAADARHPAAGDGGRAVSLDHQQFHAVGEGAFLDRYLLRQTGRQTSETDRQAKRLAKRSAVGVLYSCFCFHGSNGYGMTTGRSRRINPRHGCGRLLGCSRDKNKYRVSVPPCPV